MNTEKWLYPNYTEYCHTTGSRPIGLRRFVNLLSDVCLNQLGCLVEKGRDRYGSYFLGLKIRGKGDEDAPLFVTDLFNTTDNTEVDIGTVTDEVTDRVTVESTASDKCDGSDGKSYSLLNVEIQLAQIEHYTTALEKELQEKENFENNPSPASAEQAQKNDGDRLQANGYTDNEPAPTVTNHEDEELKVGDRVIYVGKKYQESIGNQVMSVVKISVHWSGNQVTCSYDQPEGLALRDRGWTTWIPENSLKRVDR